MANQRIRMGLRNLGFATILLAWVIRSWNKSGQQVAPRPRSSSEPKARPDPIPDITPLPFWIVQPPAREIGLMTISELEDAMSEAGKVATWLKSSLDFEGRIRVLMPGDGSADSFSRVIALEFGQAAEPKVWLIGGNVFAKPTYVQEELVAVLTSEPRTQIIIVTHELGLASELCSSIDPIEEVSLLYAVLLRRPVYKADSSLPVLS